MLGWMWSAPLGGNSADTRFDALLARQPLPNRNENLTPSPLTPPTPRPTSRTDAGEAAITAATGGGGDGGAAASPSAAAPPTMHFLGDTLVDKTGAEVPVSVLSGKVGGPRAADGHTLPLARFRFTRRSKQTVKVIPAWSWGVEWTRLLKNGVA
jgi:hypothetical protein